METPGLKYYSKIPGHITLKSRFFKIYSRIVLSVMCTKNKAKQNVGLVTCGGNTKKCDMKSLASWCLLLFKGHWNFVSFVLFFFLSYIG